MGLNNYAHWREKVHVLFIHLPPPGSAPPPFLSNSSIPLCPLLSLFSPLCHFSLEALVLTSSSALTSAFSLPLFFRTLFALFLFSFFFPSPSPFESPLIFFLLSRHLLSMGSSIAPIHRGVSSLCYSFLYALPFSLPLCRRSTPPPPPFFLFPQLQVLIKRDSQFNYFYSWARPLESRSFFSVFLHILSFQRSFQFFLPWLSFFFFF